MGHGKSQLGFAGKASLLLHLAVVLLFLQIALWVNGQQYWVVPSHIAAVSAADEQAGAHTPTPIRSELHDTARSLVDDQRRYYDPGLAMASENLDAASRYFSAMALEECYALSQGGLSRFRDDFMRRLAITPSAAAGHDRWVREYAFSRSNRDCLGFDGTPISPGYILGLIQSAARDGDPRAIARTLLFRDLAESKVGSFDVVARLLSTGDPHVIRDVGLYLTRGESTLTLRDGNTPVRATTLAVAWELVACDFGLDCGADSKLLNNLCAYQGQCAAFSYEDWLGRYTESREEFAEILRVRLLLRRGVLLQDWQLLGLSMLTP